MRRKNLYLAVIIAALLLPIASNAQQWTPEQQEVWQTVENCWKAWEMKDEPAAKRCFHEEYSFWWAEDVLPFGKDLVETHWRVLREGNQTVAFDLRPAAIIVRGNAALVQWGVRGFTRDSGGDPGQWTERASMMMVKEDGRWQYLGGGGSPLQK